MEPSTHKPRDTYTSDVSDAEWEFCQPYLLLMREDAPQRQCALRELFNALRYIVRCGSQWRMMPHDLPPWQMVYQHAQRWMKAGCFEVMAHDLREPSLLTRGHKAQPTAAIMNGRPCSPLQKAEVALVTTATNAVRAARCTSRWTLWAICWRCG